MKATRGRQQRSTTVGSEVVSEAKRLIRTFGYRGAVWEGGVVLDGGQARIHFLRVTLVARPLPRRVERLVSSASLVLLRLTTDVERARRLMDYCLATRRGDAQLKSVPPPERGFRLAGYTVPLFGNFIEQRPRFEVSHLARTLRSNRDGRPCFIAEYAVHDSVGARLPQELRLLHHDPPFATVYDAYDHYFGTITSSLTDRRIVIVLPVYVGRLPEPRLDGDTLHIDVEANPAAARRLALGVVAQGLSGERYRKQFSVTGRPIECPLGFAPDSFEVGLHLGAHEIDRFQWIRRTAAWSSTILGSAEDESSGSEVSTALFSPDLIAQQPPEVRQCLAGVEDCVRARLWVPAALMIRKTLDMSISATMRSCGKEGALYENTGRERTLEARVGLLAAELPSIRRRTQDLLDMKWFGDVAAHVPMDLSEDEIVTRLVPRLRAFLTSLGQAAPRA